jgi:hypothetical protein
MSSSSGDINDNNIGDGSIDYEELHRKCMQERQFGPHGFKFTLGGCFFGTLTAAALPK